jgi:hypothetical protein
MARKTKDQLHAYGLSFPASEGECDREEPCEDFVDRGFWDLCIYHQGFVDGFDFARTIPPVEMPMPTTIKVVAGTPRLNE